MRGVKRFCGFLLGLVFLLSGFLKLMDPVGTGLIVEEYLKFFNTPFAIPVSKLLGMLLSLLEIILGAGLVAGVWHMEVGIATGVLMAVFTTITVILWIANPPMDCGCFGEAVHLTHFQSLVKNIVLLALWALSFFLPGKEMPPKNIKYVSFFIAVFSALAFGYSSYIGIPAMDFIAFKPGAFLLQAGGGEDAPLLSVCDAEGEYRDEALAEGSVLVISAYDYDRLSSKNLQNISDLRAAAQHLGLSAPLVVTGEIPEGASYSSDRRTLMTLNRSNGGATLFRDGQLIAKWPVVKFPDEERLSELMSLDSAEAIVKENTPKRLKLQGFLLYVFAVLLLL